VENYETTLAETPPEYYESIGWVLKHAPSEV